jgi:hypothetical protein
VAARPTGCVQPAQLVLLHPGDGAVKRGRRLPPAFTFRLDDPLAGEDRTRPPQHGTIGPARRGFPCEGVCWTPNRFGVCKVCGGLDPRRAASGAR